MSQRFISKGFFSLKLEIPYVLDALAEQYLPLECARFSKYLVKRRGDELVAYDMRVSKYIERVIENDANLADLFEAIQTLRRLPFGDIVINERFGGLCRIG